MTDLFDKSSLSRASVIHFDGACQPNPGLMGIGWTIHDPDGNLIETGSRTAGSGTNNIAEYLALIEAMEAALDLNIRNVVAHGDSIIVVNAVGGSRRKIEKRHPNIQPLLRRALELAGRFDAFKIEWKPREKNEDADELSTAGLPNQTWYRR